MILAQRSKQSQAVFLSAGMILSVALIGLGVIYRTSQEESLEVIEKEGASQQAFFKKGEEYIRSIVSYNQDLQAPIIFKRFEGGLAHYEVQQENGQVYFYSLELVDGQIARHFVSVSDSSRVVLLTHPEAGQILSKKTITIKGQVFDESNEVFVQVIEEKTQKVLWAQTVLVERTKDQASFLVEARLTSAQTGKSLLKISTASSFIEVPINLYLE